MKANAAAIGAYLRVLREAMGYTQDDVARRLDVSLRQFQRWEHGESPPPNPELAQLAEIIQASEVHIMYLLRRTDLTEADGALLAQQYLTRRDQAEIERFVGDVPDEELDEIIEVSRRLRTDRGALAKWLGFGRGLSER